MAEDLDAFDGWPTWDSLRSTVWDQSTWRRLRAVVQLVVTLVALLALVGLTPVLLVRWGGWPLSELPGRELVERLPLTSASQQLVLVLIGLAAWGGWAAFVFGVCSQLAAANRRPRTGPQPRDGGGRPLAQRLVDSAAASLASLRSGSAVQPAPRRAAGPRPAGPDRMPDDSLIEAFGKLIEAGGNTAGGPPADVDEDDGEEEPSGASPDADRTDDASPATAPAPRPTPAPPPPPTPTPTDEAAAHRTPDDDAGVGTEADEANVDPAPDDPPVRTTTAVVSSAGHLTLSPWRIGVGTRWTGTRVTVVQKGLHVEIYDPEDRLIRNLDIDPDRRYQPSRNAPDGQ
ncbi:MAG: hypothetical protein ACRD2C_15470 [Acidimicrobiales bacterium]